MRKTIALILSIVLTLSLVCPALADELSETYYTVSVEYSDAVGRKETLGLMVSDGHVFVDAKQLAERLGYTYGKDANSVTILNTPIRTTAFTVGSTKVSHWLSTDMVDAYEAPFPSIRNEKGDWIPFEYSLLILNSAVMVADDALLIDIPTKRITDYFDDIVRNKRRYDFDWADDFGYTETDVKVIGTSSHLVNVFNGVLALDGASWASLFQQFAGRMDAYDEKYGERLATLICTESDKELRASAESIKLLEDLLSEDGSLGEMLSSTSAMLDSQVETLYKQCEKVLKKVESGNTPLASYNRTYQALERALDKRTWFSKTGENILEVQKGVSGAVGNAFTLLKVGTMVLEAVGYAQEFQNQDEFSVSALSQYLSNTSNVQGLPEKMRESMYGYTRALSGDVSGYMTKRFEDNIVEWVISTAEVADTALVAGTMPSLHEVIGMQAAGALLAWNIASATIPFISNGLSAADSFELALYAMVLQNDAFVNFSKFRNLYPADNPTSQDLFRVSQWCYTYLKSCYTAREAALASLEGKRSAIKEKVKPLVEEQNKINEEIARILVELKGANKDNEGFVYGFLPSDNRRYLNTYDEDALIQQIPLLASTAGQDSQSSVNAVESPDIDLGVSNSVVTADNDYLYIGIDSKWQEDGSLSRPKVLRVDKADCTKSEVIWEGTQTNGIGSLKLSGDTLVIASSPWLDDIAITAVKVDGTDARQIINPGSAGRYYSSRPFTTSESRVFYGAVLGSGWQVRSCELDGSDDKVLCDGPAGNPNGRIELLSYADGQVYFNMSGLDSETDYSASLCRVDASGGAWSEVMSVPSTYGPEVIDDRAYVLEGKDFVSYSLADGGREAVASLPATDAPYQIWNANRSRAYVFGASSTYLVDMNSGGVTKVGGELLDVHINMVDDLLVASSIDETVMLWDQDLQTLAALWPQANSAEAAVDASESNGAYSEGSHQGDAPTNYLGVYSADLGSGASYAVTVTEQEGQNITFSVEFMGRNYSPIYSTYAIQAEVVNGAVDFSWSDTWSNSGTGHIQFEEDELTISMVQTETAEFNRSTLSTEAMGDRVLARVSDTPGPAPESP